MADGELILKGRALTRQDKPMFRIGTLKFQNSSYDSVNGVQHFPEDVEIQFDANGAFRVSVWPGTSGESWVGRMDLVTHTGRPYVDLRVLPAEGEVDWFFAPRATEEEKVVWPSDRFPVFVDDYNKPGGPLQLTNNGTIAESHIPGNFLRVDDYRLPELFLKEYLTDAEYKQDQERRRRTQSIEFQSSMRWEYDYSVLGIDYQPIVQTFDSDRTELEGALSYPVGTTTVLVEWDAPTSGVLVLR